MQYQQVNLEQLASSNLEPGESLDLYDYGSPMSTEERQKQMAGAGMNFDPSTYLDYIVVMSDKSVKFVPYLTLEARQSDTIPVESYPREQVRITVGEVITTQFATAATSTITIDFALPGGEVKRMYLSNVDAWKSMPSG